MTPSAKLTTYRVLAVAGIAAPYIDFTNRHVPLAGVAISCVGLAAILVFVEKKKRLLPITHEEGAEKEAKIAVLIFCGSLVLHALVLSFL